MTQTNLKELVEKLGFKAEELTDDLVEKFTTYKQDLDTETRRELRKVWGCISAVCLVVGFIAGYLI